MKVLIVGDSFAADWTAKYPTGKGWCNLLAERYDVTNLAQAGCCEYRILKQLKENYVLENFDTVIVVHTSPYRLYTRKNPIQNRDLLHKNSDLIYTDIEYHANLWKNWFNKPLQTALKFFEYHYDSDYAEAIYVLIRKEIAEILSDTKTITIATPIVDAKFVIENPVIEIPQEQLRINSLNHLSEEYNYFIFNKICDELRT